MHRYVFDFARLGTRLGLLALSPVYAAPWTNSGGTPYSAPRPVWYRRTLASHVIRRDARYFCTLSGETQGIVQP
eukprot:1837292-Rhodomonas_salina.1